MKAFIRKKKLIRLLSIRKVCRGKKNVVEKSEPGRVAPVFPHPTRPGSEEKLRRLLEYQ
jgi:hypothetical protein